MPFKNALVAFQKQEKRKGELFSVAVSILELCWTMFVLLLLGSFVAICFGIQWHIVSLPAICGTACISLTLFIHKGVFHSGEQSVKHEPTIKLPNISGDDDLSD